MNVHFEYYWGVSQNDISEYLFAKGLKGKWLDQELNVYQVDDMTKEKWDMLDTLCEKGFFVNDVPVRGTIIIPPPPKLMRVSQYTD